MKKNNYLKPLKVTKLWRLFTLSILLSLSAFQVQAQYCTTNYSNGTGSGDFISLVNISGTSLNNISGPGGNPYYTFFPVTGSSTATLTIGSSYTINVAGGSYSICYISGWGDWNQDGVFDPSEYIGTSPNVGSQTQGILIAGFTIPVSANTGAVRLRFRSSDTSPGPSATEACGSTNSGYGEAEDYEVFLTSGTNCSGLPVAGNATSTQTLVCPGVGFNLNITNALVGADGIKYQWQSSPNGTAWTNLGSSQYTTLYTINSVSSTTHYRCILTCTTSAQSATSTPVVVNANPLLNCYCMAGSPNYVVDCTFDKISDFSIANVVAQGTNCDAYGFSDSTASNYTTVNLSAGNVYTLTLNTSVTGGVGDAVQAAWIDYNQNALFDANEYISLGYGPSGTYSASLTVPLMTQTGSARIRMALNANNANSGTPIDPCTYASGGSNGQILDYKVNFTAALPCSGIPNAGTALSTAASVCASDSYTLDLSVNPTTTGLVYQWQSSPNGVTAWSNITNTLTTIPYVITGQTAATYYRCIVTCTVSAQSATATPVFVDQNLFTTCYCYPGNIYCGNTNITDVAFSNLVHTAIPCSLGTGYKDFTLSQPTATITANQTYTLSTNFDVNDSYSAAGAWIDYDHNGAFDSYEYISLGTNTLTGTAITLSTTVTPPYTALAGLTQMRLKLESSYKEVDLLSPCQTNQSDGSTYEYSIFIIAAPGCSGTPAAGTTIANVSGTCPDTPVNLNLSGNSAVSGATYQWQSSLNNSTWTNMGPAQTTVPYTVTNQTTATYYRCLVTCLTSSLSQTSTSLLISQNAVTACYCIPPAQDCNVGDEINQVVMGSVLTNTSTCSASGYSDYTSSVTTATINAAAAYSMSVTVGSDYNEDVSVWIDYDHNGMFDTNEYTYIGSPSGSGNYVVVGNITISPTASLGLTRMRVRNMGKGQVLYAPDACISPTGGGERLLISNSFGETEDYSVYILPPNCSGNNLPPNLTVASSAATVCPNGAVTLTVTGTIPNYTGLTYQWQSSPTGSGYNNVGSVVPNPSVTVNPTQSNYYICNILCNGSPAINTASVYVAVNAPAINATASAYTICPAEPTTLTATGAVSYTWTNNAALTASTIVTPTVNTTYTVTGTGSNGCVASNTVSLFVKPATGITGTITTASVPVPGTAILYKYEPYYTKFDSVTSQAIAGNGGYNFPSVNYGIYIIKAVPTASTLQVTYGLNSINWKTATTITHACATADVQNISVVSLTSLPLGPGALSGRITEGQGFGQRPGSAYSPLAPGSPIGGIVVKGGKNPGGNMFAQTTTNSNGMYSLNGLPNNNPGEEYFILVDIPGLDTNNTYHRVITSVNNIFTNLDFVVDSAKINPVQNSVGIKSLSVIENQIKVYPNPANGKVSVLYTLPANSMVSIELYDILGQAVKTILPLTEQSSGEHLYTASLSDLTAGIYFVKLKINNAETSVKLFVTN